MASTTAIEVVTSLPTDSLHAEWLESGMQFQRVKVACVSEPGIRTIADKPIFEGGLCLAAWRSYTSLFKIAPACQTQAACFKAMLAAQANPDFGFIGEPCVFVGVGALRGRHWGYTLSKGQSDNQPFPTPRPHTELFCFNPRSRRD